MSDSFKMTGGELKVEHQGTYCTKATFSHAGKDYNALDPLEMQEYLNAVCRGYVNEWSEEEQEEIEQDVYVVEIMNGKS